MRALIDPTAVYLQRTLTGEFGGSYFGPSALTKTKRDCIAIKRKKKKACNKTSKNKQKIKKV